MCYIISRMRNKGVKKMSREESNRLERLMSGLEEVTGHRASMSQKELWNLAPKEAKRTVRKMRRLEKKAKRLPSRSSHPELQSVTVPRLADGLMRLVGNTLRVGNKVLVGGEPARQLHKHGAMMESDYQNYKAKDSKNKSRHL